MSVFAYRLVVALGTLSASVPGAAQGQNPAPPTPPQVWQLDWQKNHCTISTGDPATIGLSVWMTPGDPRTDLYLIGSPKALPGITGKTLTVTLMPSGRSFSSTAVQNLSEATSVRAMAAYEFPEEFPARFAGSTEVRIEGLEAPVSIPVIGSAKAMAALRQQCIDEKLAEWGIDPKVYEALRVPPTDPPGSLWFTADDYPSAAKAAGEEGEAIARMDVDATGRVTACAIVVSSGSTSIDKATCDVSLQRGRFHPAIGADGSPMAAPRILPVTWHLEA
jgi:TonB family protein